MLTPRTPQLRPERLIAGARVILAAFSLFAVWLDPTEPTRNADVAYSLLGAYVLYSLVVLALVWRIRMVSRRWPVLAHAVDLLFFALFIFFTTGSGSPFTVYFVFALICGTLRWQARGTIWTAVVTLSLFVVFGFYFGMMTDDPTFDLRAFINRGVYLSVLAVLLAYVGIHEQRLVQEMRLLTSWPNTTTANLESMTRDLLAYAEPLLGSPHAVLAWGETDSPWIKVASWKRGAWSYERQPASVLGLPANIADRAFIHVRGEAKRTLIQADPKSLDLTRWEGEPIAVQFLKPFSDWTTMLSAPVMGDGFSGRLVIFDKEDVTRDDLAITEIMAGVVASRFDAFYLNQQLQMAAATEERIKLAHDLHDGVLQSFTGIALRLAAIRTMMTHDKGQGSVAREVEDLQQILASEQRELRFFIQELKPTTQARGHGGLAVGLVSLVQRIEKEWDLAVDLHVELADSPSDEVSRNVYHLVREALVNSARHGLASLATVRVVATAPSELTLSITDDGRGFPFSGRYSADELARLDLGPKTLRERVRSMHGALTLESSPTGAALHIVLPSLAA